MLFLQDMQMNNLTQHRKSKQQSRAVARIPRDAAAVCFWFKLSSMTTFTTSLRVAKLRKPCFRAPNVYRRKTELNAKWPL